MTRRAIRGRWARAALAALWLAGTLLAPATVAAINLPPSQEGKSVYDLADVWDDSSVAQAEAIIGAVRSSTQAEIAVVSWPTGLDTVSTELAEADARTIMDTWGVGRAGFDDGLVVLFDLDKSLEHGQIYLRTGAGFKAGYLTDEEAKSIVDETMLPLAADGSLDAAMLAGLAQIASHTAGFDPVTPGSPGSSGSGGTPNPKEPVGPVLPPSREGVYVYDIAHIWTEATIQEAQRIATAIRQRTQAQIAVVSWPTGYGSVDTGTARADAIKIMDTWGVGRAGVNDGLVVLFDMDDTLHHGQIYVYAGSGFLEQYLDVGESVALVNDEMLPKAKDGDLDGALLQGMRVIDRVVQPGGNPDRWLRNLMLALVAGGVAAIAVLGLLAFLRMWWTRGRDARVVLIDDSVLLPAPPPNLTPALATVLRRDEVDDDSFTSALVDLGHRGLLTFEQADGNKKHINLVTPAAPLADQNSLEARRRPLGTAETRLLNRIRAEAGDGTIEWKELQSGKGKELYDSFKPAAGEAALSAGWFRDDPNKITGLWVGIAVGLAVLAVVIGFFFVFDLSESSNLFRPGRERIGIAIVALFLVGLFIGIFSRFLAARTEDGARTLAMALAYRNTLRFEMKQSHTVDEAVEKTSSRLPWITTPDLLTVWAVALGLKNDVDKLIRQTMEAARQTGTSSWSPAWYSGSGSVGSVANISNMISSISTTSASSSGGGYGGGSSGGGGGGGGGF